MDNQTVALLVNGAAMLAVPFLLLNYSNARFIILLLIAACLAYYGHSVRLDTALQLAAGHASTLFYLMFFELLYWQVFRSIYRTLYRQEPTITWPGATTRSMDILNNRRINFGDGLFTAGILLGPIVTVLMMR